MKLPTIPKAFNKRSLQTIRFGGINLTESASEGELRDSKNMTTAYYPTLQQRKARTQVSGYSAPVDLYEWDGKLIVVDNGMLYIDGVPVTNVTSGKKQFAVVNTKLLVFPDKLCIDLTNNEFKHLSGEISLSTSATITDHSISSATAGTEFISGITFLTRWDSGDAPAVYTYDEADLKTAFSNGEWDLSGLTSAAKSPFPSGTVLSAGDCFIPALSNGAYSPVFGSDTTGYNTDGYYAKVTGVAYTTAKMATTYYLRATPENAGTIVETLATNTEIEVFGRNSYGWLHARHGSNVGWVYETGVDGYSSLNPVATITFDVTRTIVVEGGTKFSDLFSVGQRLYLSGSTLSLTNTDNAVIAAIDDATNTMTFANGTFRVPDRYGHISVQPGTYYMTDGNGHYWSFEVEDYQRICVWYIIDDVAYRWNRASGIVTQFETSLTQAGEEIESFPYDLSTMSLKLGRYIPDLDYICSSQNRLVGVNNSEKTLYISALGDPSDFFSHPDTADGAFSVAIGSEGDFTGLIEYNGICAFKEFRLHKILGTNPTDYYMSERSIAGVQAGSYRSMKIINNVLYYKGPYGVYAFGGNTPSLISYNLGTDTYTDAVAESDGRGYYIAMTDPAGVSRLYVYDLIHRTWIIEDTMTVDAMTTVEGVVHFLSEGAIYRTWQDDDESISWMVEFVPFTEVIKTSSSTTSLLFRKKGYTALELCLEMEEGASVSVYTKQDNDIWRLKWNHTADRFLTKNVPLPLGRCTRFGIKLTGTGKTIIRGISREAVIGSEVLG